MTNKDIMRRIYEEAFNQDRRETLDELVAPDFVNHTAPPGTPTGPGPLHALLDMLRTAFPDGHTHIEELVAEGDVVVMRNRFTGTHLGEFMGFAATGRAFDQRQFHMMRFRNGQVVEHWGVREDLQQLEQLGLVELEATPAGPLVAKP
jgi:predicted ester cyclase